MRKYQLTVDTFNGQFKTIIEADEWSTIDQGHFFYRGSMTIAFFPLSWAVMLIEE